jgi:hypothetical protein
MSNCAQYDPPTPPDSPPAPAGTGHADALPALIAIYGPASSNGLGSAVFQADAVPAEALPKAALACYRQFVGASWETREADWRAGFRALYQHPSADTRGIAAELHALTEPALRGVVSAMTDDLEDPAAVRAALVAVFDAPDLTDRHLYALGDGGQMAGVEVAARFSDGRGVFLVLLLD